MKKNIIIISFIIFLFVLIQITPVQSNNKNIHKNQLTTNEEYEYYTYKKMTDLILDLQKNNSDIMKVESLGKTYQNRDVWLVKFSDNVNEKENEPGVLLMGAHHGNEKPSYEVLIYFINYIVENYNKSNIDNDEDGKINEDIIDGKDNDHDGLIDEDPSEERITNVVDNTQIFIIPMVSPDGVEANSRKNCAPPDGVNLNRNYGYRWYLYDLCPSIYGGPWVSDPNSFNYRGEYPFSENETQAVKTFVENNDINISLSYHTYSEILLYPWMHTSAKTPDEDLFISVGENITDINGYYLYTGKDYPFPIPGGTLGTSENWLYGEHGILSYTVELCRTRAPRDPKTVYEYCQDHVGVNLYVCERASDIDIDKPPKTRLFPKPFSHVLSLLHKMFSQ